MSSNVSIIVPLYNCEKWIQKCITSIQEQTVNEIEIVLVDDGSTDYTYRISHKSAQIDKRIILLQKNNAGPGATRNTGIKIASNSFVGFVDADDFVMPNMYEVLLESVKNNKCPVSMCGYNFVKNDNIINRYPTNTLDHEKIYTKKEITNILIPDLLGESKLINGAVWNKIYSKEWLLQHQYLIAENISFGEDWWFNLNILELLDRIVFINCPLYNYVKINSDSLTGKLDVSTFDCYTTLFMKACKIGLKYHVDLSLIHKKYLKQTITMLRKIDLAKGIQASFLKHILNIPEFKKTFILHYNGSMKLDQEIVIVLKSGFIGGWMIAYMMTKMLKHFLLRKMIQKLLS